MQRIFKYGDIQNISLTSDKELNMLIYWTTSYVIIHRSYALLKMVHFFWPTLYKELGFKIWHEVWWKKDEIAAESLDGETGESISYWKLLLDDYLISITNHYITVSEEWQHIYHTVGFNVTYLIWTYDLQIGNFILNATIVQVVQTTDLFSARGNYQLRTDANTHSDTHKSKETRSLRSSTVLQDRT